MRHLWVVALTLQAVLASQQPFNVHEDLYAFPQYEVIWQEDLPVTHEFAAEKLSQHKSRSASDTSLRSIHRYHALDPRQSTSDGESAVASYESLVLGDQKYLCSLPVILIEEPIVPSNRTADEEANDLVLAVHRGRKLLQGMEGRCIYFISGWWSYSFCYNEGVRQFHPLPSGRNVPIYPPVEDKSVDAYILGRFHGDESNEDDDMGFEEDHSKNKAASSKFSAETGLAKLEVKGHKGSTRYLTQVLKGGTVCDLTGEARSIEVQFRCENMPTDRITVIKETSICQYRMVISTPRLCNDAAFRPPVGPKPHPISCSPVMASEDIGQYLETREQAAAAKEAEIKDSAGKAANKFFDHLKAAFDLDTADANLIDEDGKGVLDEEDIGILTSNIKKNLPRIGDIEVGGHNLIPQGTILEKGVVVGGPGSEKFIATIARSDGFTMSAKELSKLNIRGGKELELIKDKVSRTAEGAEWQIDVVETPRGKELRGIIGDAPRKAAVQKDKPKTAPPAEQQEDHGQNADHEDEDAEGSEERYKEDL